MEHSATAILKWYQTKQCLTWFNWILYISFTQSGLKMIRKLLEFNVDYFAIMLSSLDPGIIISILGTVQPEVYRRQFSVNVHSTLAIANNFQVWQQFLLILSKNSVKYFWKKNLNQYYFQSYLNSIQYFAGKPSILKNGA